MSTDLAQLTLEDVAPVLGKLMLENLMLSKALAAHQAAQTNGAAPEVTADALQAAIGEHEEGDPA